MLNLQAALPIWAFLLIAVVLILVSLEAGYRFGQRQRQRPRHDSRAIVSDLATPMVGLLGLMLAFTFGWSATRFDSRRSARLQEAQATERLYRLTDFLPAADRARVRAILLEYVDVSLGVRSAATFEKSFARREELHRELWRVVSAAGQADPHSTIIGQVVTAANDVFDVHLMRSVLASSNRIPQGIQIGLIGIVVLTMAMIGYQMGLTGSRRSPLLIPLTAALTLVLFLITDLDRPVEGWLLVRDQALQEARRELRAWP